MDWKETVFWFSHLWLRYICLYEDGREGCLGQLFIYIHLQNTSCIRKPQVISCGGRGGAHPLHPPPRSAPGLFLVPKLAHNFTAILYIPFYLHSQWRNQLIPQLTACLHGSGGLQIGEETCSGSVPTYHVNVINLKWEIIWIDGLPHQNRLPLTYLESPTSM